MISRRWPYFLLAIWVLALGSTPLWAGNYVVRLAITMTPAARSVTVYRSLHEIIKLTDQDELDLSDVIPNLSCRVSDIFD